MTLTLIKVWFGINSSRGRMHRTSVESYETGVEQIGEIARRPAQQASTIVAAGCRYASSGLPGCPDTIELLKHCGFGSYRDDPVTVGRSFVATTEGFGDCLQHGVDPLVIGPSDSRPTGRCGIMTGLVKRAPARRG